MDLLESTRNQLRDTDILLLTAVRKLPIIVDALLELAILNNL
jgi:hypothetical protein